MAAGMQEDKVVLAEASGCRKWLHELFAPCPVCGGTTNITGDEESVVYCESCGQMWDTITHQPRGRNLVSGRFSGRDRRRRAD